MKKIILCLAAAVAAALIPVAQARALTAESATLNGCGRVLVSADCAYIEVCIETIAQDAEKAEAQSETAEKSLSDLFSPYGCITEQFYNFYPSPQTYEICRTFLCKTDRVGEIQAIRKAISKIAGLRIYGVRYELNDSAEAEREALSRAIADAEEKAKALDDGLCLVDFYEVSCWKMPANDCSENGAAIQVEVCVQARFSKCAEATQPTQQGNF